MKIRERGRLLKIVEHEHLKKPRFACYHLGENDHRFHGCGLNFFELEKSVIFVTCCRKNFFELIYTSVKKNLLRCFLCDYRYL